MDDDGIEAIELAEMALEEARAQRDAFRAALQEIASHRPDMHHGDAQVMSSIACKALGIPRPCDSCDGNVEQHAEWCPMNPEALTS